jgi:HEPN domain-containing protein
MPNRSADWLTQGVRDLELARHAASGGFYEWACFAAQQGAEKGVKGVIASLGGEARGHAIIALATALPARAALSTQLLDAARRLDRHYIPTRYPNGFDRGVPRDYFTAADAAQAIADADAILGFCKSHVR